jgi:hypothetical protein
MTILDGKILYNPVWNLRVVLSPEFIVDYISTHSAMQQKNYAGGGSAFPFENLVVKIFYDEICLLQHQFLDYSTVTLEKNLDDTEEFVDHKLKIFFSGADIDNNFLRNNHTITLGINAKLYVEGIDLSWYLNNHACFHTTNGPNKYGMNTITENGYYSINIQTPIYPWMFCNEQAILDQFYRKD